MPNIIANNITIHYERSGGAKPPLLLLHGITDSGACWPRVAKALSPDYDLIMLDARGHGQSDKPANGYSWDVLADDVAAVIKALGLTKPGLMGHSMGALTSALVAAHYPELPGYLVLEDPPMRDVEAQARRVNNMRASLAARKPMTTEQMIDYRAAEDPGIKVWDTVEYGPWSEAKRQASLDMMEMVENPLPDYKGIFPHITCPTLIIAADPAKQPAVDPAAGTWAAKINPHIKLVTIAGAGHNIRREKFAEYMAEVVPFLKEHAR
jgi:N-formylmaleamate deformylase